MWGLILFLFFLAILLAFLPQDYGVKYYVKCMYYSFCLSFGGMLGGLLSLPYGRTTDNHYRIFAVFQMMNSLLNIQFIKKNVDSLESDEPFVIIANHQSALDVLGMTFVWPKNCVVMLKSSLKFLPGFNLCAYLCEAIYINRFSKEKAHKTVDGTVDDIMKNKKKVWIYPEGTRNPTSTLLPFKKGAFRIAKQANIPIVCCCFSTHDVFYNYKEKIFRDNGKVLIDLLPPVHPADFETVDDLSEHCRKIMQERIGELNKEIRSITSSS
ncbi:unnamed protein product [Auanema sp. JU1783]|nr:unnamed protein product [Auanema sp. JU1783]